MRAVVFLALVSACALFRPQTRCDHGLVMLDVIDRRLLLGGKLSVVTVRVHNGGDIGFAATVACTSRGRGRPQPPVVRVVRVPAKTHIPLEIVVGPDEALSCDLADVEVDRGFSD